MVTSKHAEPLFVTLLVGVSLLLSTWLATSTPLPASWYLANGLLHVVALVWLALSARYRSPGTALLLSGSFMVIVVLLCYGGAAVALSAGNTSSPVVLRMPGVDDFAYVTWSALVVAVGGVTMAFARFFRRPREDGAVSEPLDRLVEPGLADRLWFYGWALQAGALACYVLFTWVQGKSPLDYGIFFGEVSSQTKDELEVLPQFLLAGIDLAIPGLLYIVLGARRRFGRAMGALVVIGVNLILFANLGFKYRIVVVLLALAILFETREALRGRGRSMIAAAVIAVAVIGFFAVQVRRGDVLQRRDTTLDSYTTAEYGQIVESSVDIVTPYAAYHAASLPLLEGRSYYEVPLLLVPKVIWSGKPTPSTVTAINQVIAPDTGAAFPLWAEADANFGLLGLFGIGLVFGRVVTWVDGLPNRKPEWLVVRAVVTASLPSVLSRPMFFWVVQQLLFVVGPALIAVWWLGRRRQAEPRSAAMSLSTRRT